MDGLSLKNRRGASTVDRLYEWNALYPYDFLYREKFNIPYNSELHRSLSYIDIRFYFLDLYLRDAARKHREELKKEEELRSKGELYKTPSEDELFNAI